MEFQTRNILIAGGTGLIGSHLTALLERNNFRVAHLSRMPHKEFRSFHWDPEKQVIDPASLQWANTIVNLAGENVADGRWTARRKRKIANSRIFASELLAKGLTGVKHNVDSVIQASAIGYYGNTGNRIVHENFPPGSDFLANTCVRWEKQADLFRTAGIRTVVFRFGLVLSDKGGLLPKLIEPMRLRIAPVFGSGTQYMSWIHINDLCRLIGYAARNTNLNGTYNAVSPGPVTNYNFMKLLTHIRGGGHLLLHIPGFILRLLIGEKSYVLTTGQRISSEKSVSTGFTFNYPALGLALRDLAAKD